MLEEMKLKDLKKILGLLGDTEKSPYKIGENYFIRTVTMIQIGKLVAVTDKELVLENAVWVADTGRFTQALVDGNLSEVELFPKGEVIVGRGAVIDACVWSHAVPEEQK